MRTKILKTVTESVNVVPYEEQYIHIVICFFQGWEKFKSNDVAANRMGRSKTTMVARLL